MTPARENELFEKISNIHTALEVHIERCAQMDKQVSRNTRTLVGNGEAGVVRRLDRVSLLQKANLSGILFLLAIAARELVLHIVYKLR